MGFLTPKKNKGPAVEAAHQIMAGYEALAQEPGSPSKPEAGAKAEPKANVEAESKAGDWIQKCLPCLPVEARTPH